jgi:hypothetical protein
VYAAFLQNAPVVRHTRGFTPGWYAVPRWGTPNASPSSSFPASGGPDPRSPTEDTDWANSSNPLKVPGWACLQVRWPKRLPAAAGRGRSEHWKRTTNPLAQSAKSDLPQSFPASAGPGPRSPVEAPIPSASPSTPPPQNRREHPVVCGVPSERTDCAAYPGFHPGLVCVAPLGHSKRLTTPRAPTASTSPAPSAPSAPSPQNTWSTTIVFPQWRPSNHPTEGHTRNPRSGSGIGPERA